NNGVLISRGSFPNGDVLYTSDGGETWEQATGISGRDLYALYFTDASFGVAVGSTSDIYISNDSGKTWTRVDTDISSLYVNSVHFVDNQNGWAAGPRSLIRTVDGGQKWSTRQEFGGNDVRFVSLTKSFLATNDGILMSTDDGYKWPSIFPSSTNTPTNTFTPTPTNTGTPMPTYTSTITKTITPSETDTHTATPTETPIIAESPPPTQTFTQTPLPNQPLTQTPTVMPSLTPTPYTEGDPFEIDDSCSHATSQLLDGSLESHTFHDQGDADWVKLDVSQGMTYTIEARVPAASPADLILELYDRCEGAAQETQDYSFSPDVRLTFTASTPGPYYLRLLNNQTSVYGAHVSYQLSVRQHGEKRQPGALIIVAGRNRERDPLQENIHNITNRVYRLWRNNGHPAERIHYLATDQSLDADGDKRPDVNGLPSKANLRDAITTWAKELVGAEQALTLYMMDHGAYNKLYLDEPRRERLTPQDLDEWLTELEEAIPGLQVNVIVEACNSGSFIVPEQSLSKVGRVIVTSAGARTLAWASRRGAVFSDTLMDALAMSKPLNLAFAEAQEHAIHRHNDQTAWLDDNGNGSPNDGEDGDMAAQRGFHNVGSFEPGPVQWLPYVVSVESREASIIGANRETSQPNSATREIWAEVRDDSRVDTVLAVVYPPSFLIPEGEIEDLVEGPPPITLVERGNNQYAGTYSEFNEFGTYRIVVYAVDEDGLRSRPKVVQLSRGTKISLPVIFLPVD
ncbi:MAG: C13 family peptidase, partial [Chloroflexota bacterium]